MALSRYMDMCGNNNVPPAQEARAVSVSLPSSKNIELDQILWDDIASYYYMKRIILGILSK